MNEGRRDFGKFTFTQAINSNLYKRFERRGGRDVRGLQTGHPEFELLLSTDLVY